MYMKLPTDYQKKTNLSIVVLIVVSCFSFFCTSGIYAQTPEGISTDFQLWLKADAGVIGSTPVTSWQDQSTSANNATAANSPHLNISALNFNPWIEFEETQTDYFSLTDLTLLFTGSVLEVITYNSNMNKTVRGR